MKILNYRIVTGWLFVLLLASIVVAQENEKPVPPIATGNVVNGKATRLVQPPYPPAAKAVKASGAVNVQVVINENGDVISAGALSGHPLLRAAAVQAARQSKFAPTKLSGQPVKVTGVIVYNFVGDPLSPFQLGFALAVAEMMPELDDSTPVYQISYSIPTEWTEVSTEVARLQTKQRQVNAKRTQNESPAINRDQPNETSTRARESKGVVFKVGTISSRAKEEEIKESHTEIIGKLVNLLKNRYASDEARNWEFSLGLRLGKLKVQLEDDSALRLNLSELNTLIQTAPSNVRAEFIDELKTIASYANKSEIGAVEKGKIEVFLNRMK